MAVTTNLNINFLRKPGPGDLIADAKLLKVGKRLVVGEVAIYSDGEGDPVATSRRHIPSHEFSHRYVITNNVSNLTYNNYC